MPLKASDLHVVSVINNPRRWRSRVRLLREFIEHMREQGVSLTLVDHAFGERDHNIDPDDPVLNGVRHVRVRGGASQEIWIKEALVRVGVRHLPDDWRYLAWVDADVRFERRDMALETLHMLQHHQVGQPWSHSVDLGPDRSPMANEWGNAVDRSFSAAWVAGDVDTVSQAYGFVPGREQSRALLQNRDADPRQHYGFAWSARREAYEGVGGLPDWMITGAADYHMACAFAGKLGPSDNYRTPGCERRLRDLAERCDRHVRQDIGVVPGLLMHGWHGSKQKRFYLSREEIVRESGFDPDLDLTWDWQGIPSLSSDNRLLRDGLRRLNTVRDEDSND